jgi:hypothetical protein
LHRLLTTVVFPGSWSSPFYSKLTKKGVSRYVDTGGRSTFAATFERRILVVPYPAPQGTATGEILLGAVKGAKLSLAPLISL